MSSTPKKDLEHQLVLAVREYGISTVLFRNAVGDTIGVNVTDMECLGLLFHKGIATPTELSKHTGLTTGSTTAMLDRLEKAGLITRKPNPNDRRGVIIEVNKTGAKKLEPLFIGGRLAQDTLVASYSKDALAVLISFFTKFDAIYKDQLMSLTSKVKT